MGRMRQRAAEKIKSKVHAFHAYLGKQPVTVTKGLILISSVIPAILAGRKRFENRSYRIKPGFYALYGSLDKKAFRERYLSEHPEERTDDFRSAVRKVETKIVGVIQVHRSYYRGDPDYPLDPHAQGDFTHAITFHPLQECDYISGAYKRGQIIYMKLACEIQAKLAPIILL